MTINFHNLVKRQTPQSAFSHFYVHSMHGNPAEARAKTLRILIEEGLKAHTFKRASAREAILVTLPPHSRSHGFMSPVCHINQLAPTTRISVSKTRRNDAEADYLSTYAEVDGNMDVAKTPATSVCAVLYLPEYVSTHNAYEAAHMGADVDWDLVSINASIYPSGEEPMHPTAMARNQLLRVGGSGALYTTEEWALAVEFWGSHVMCRPLNAKAEPEYWG